MNYYVNKNPQKNGYHEVHRANCDYIPNLDNRVYLGDFSNCQAAVREAMKHFPQSNGCVHCANPCHSG